MKHSRKPVSFAAAAALIALVSASGAEAGLKCFSAPAAAPLLPDSVEVGVETVHADQDKIITIDVPLPGPTTAGRMRSMNSKRDIEPMPLRYVVSDGSVRRAFIGVDHRPGTRLDRCIDELVSELPRGRNGSLDREIVFEFLRDHLMDYLRPIPQGVAMAWDQNLTEAPILSTLFTQARDLKVGHFPLSSGVRQPVAPLESYLEQGYGACIHKSLVASMILEKLRIPHRIVMGGSMQTGHTWIELSDGRILDPTWQILDQPNDQGMNPGWMMHGQTPVFRDQIYPYLVLQ